MQFAYTKTLAIVAVAQIAIRIPLTYVVDPYPFASFGVFWGGIAASMVFLILGPILDFVSWIAWMVRGGRKRSL